MPRAVVAKFSEALKRTAREGAEDESGVRIEPAPDTPRDAARSNASRPTRGRVERSEAPRHDALRHESPRAAPAPAERPRLGAAPRSEGDRPKGPPKKRFGGKGGPGGGYAGGRNGPAGRGRRP